MNRITAAILLASLAALAAQTAVVTRTGFLMGDFRAFYCAARVTSQGENPYLAQPLRTCEIGVGRNLFFRKNPGVTIPAPLPGYVLAALVPLGALPFVIAATLWTILLLCACAACIVMLSRFAGIEWQVALAVFALSLCTISLPFGEIVPLALACICAAAYFAWRSRWRTAALFAAGAMIEPHLGLPVCIALAVWAPPTRMPLALSLGVLALVSLAALGPATNFEYFTSVLPAHALSEAARDTQYSLTAVLFSLGAPESVALRAGLLWYGAMLALGTLVAGLLARKTGNNAFFVCIPPAFAVFGGSFIHVTQIAAALPAAVLLISCAKKEQQPLAAVALLLLVVPWTWAISPALVIAPLFPVGYLAWRYWNGNASVALLAALGAAVLLWGLIELAGAAPSVAAHARTLAIDPRLAEATWSNFTQKSSTNGIAAWMLRVPTWVGLLLLLTRALAYAPREAR
jgi:hypothetical protein